MTSFDKAAHPRLDSGLTGAGQFTTKNHPPASLTVPAPQAGPVKEGHEALDTRARAVWKQVEAGALHQDALMQDYRRVVLKTMGEGLKEKYPDGRYLNLTVDEGRYWADNVTDADGNILAEDDELDIFDGQDDVTEILDDRPFDLSDSRWMNGVTDDDGESAGFGRHAGSVSIDLDKAEALDLGPVKSPLEAAFIGDDNRDVLTGAVDDAISHLEDQLMFSGDYDKDDLEDMRARIADMRRITGGQKG